MSAVDQLAERTALVARIEVYATADGLDPAEALERIRAVLTDHVEAGRSDAYANGYIDGLARLKPDPAHKAAFPPLRVVSGG